MAQKLVQKHAERIKLFEESIKSKYTRKSYLLYFKKYTDHLGSKFNSLLEAEDPKQIEQSIIDYIILLKKTKSYAAIHNYVAAIIAFYKINDIVLNIDKIARFMPDKRKANKDRGYEHEEILKLLGVADERMRVVILLLASTGMRIGAIPGILIRNLESVKIGVENSKIYKITVYENDNEEHFTYCTPEAAKNIDEYLEIRKRYGEKLNPNSFLVREQFDIRDPFAISKCQKTRTQTLVNKIILLAERSGIRQRQILEENQKEKHLASSFRKDVAVCHGFRKFFTKQLVNSKLNPEIREMLMGHKIGLASVYYKPTDDDDDFLIEYQKAINNLTINEVNKLKMQVKKLEIEKSEFERLKQDVAILKRKRKIR
jgi:integrase